MKNLRSRVLITSALPYANGPIHIGYIVEAVQTDIWVRFLKLRGHEAYYCCADDTHGAPIEINAAKQGVTPKEFIDKWYNEHLEDLRLYHIDHDSYYSTHSPENQYYTELIFQRLKDNGHIYTKEIELTYCEQCNRYLPDRYVKGECPKCGAKDQYGDVCEKCNATYSTTDLINPYCSLCGNQPIRKGSLHYFFRLSAFAGWINEWLNSNPNLQPEIKNQILRWVREGLQDWCISRDGPYFGFRIPGEENKYFYVWLDAPIGYIASTANLCKTKSFTVDEIWERNESSIVHFIGKDIIYFHLLFWPAVLKGADFHVPDNIVVHGFLTVNGEKMSKSRGTFLTAQEFKEYLDPELLRYHYAANLSHTMSDLDLDLTNLLERINNDLVSNIANLVYRTLSFLERYFDGKTSTILSTGLLNEVRAKADMVSEAYYAYEYRDAVREILEISSLGNKYFQDNQPWELVKRDPGKTQRVLTDCVNIVKAVAILIKPILPVFASKVEEQLALADFRWADLEKVVENHRIGKAKIILKKIEPIVLSKPLEEDEHVEEAKSGEDPSKIYLRVAKVVDIREHPAADKLYILKVDLGTEHRQLCAGLKPYYPDRSDLLGKHLVIVTNLKPAKLRGELSEGMLLAADDGKTVGILNAPNTTPGTHVIVEGINEYSTKLLSFEDFSKFKIEAKGGHAYLEGRMLMTTVEAVVVDRIKEGRIR